MAAALLVAVVVLTVITAANIALLLAVIRRLKHVQQLVAPPLSLPAVGTHVSPFSVRTVDGDEIDDTLLSDGRKLVSILSNTCPACMDLADRLAATPQLTGQTVTFVVAQSDFGDGEILRKMSGVRPLAIVQAEDEAMGAFGRIGAFPTLLVTDRGQIVAAGTSLDEVLPALEPTIEFAAG